MSNIKNKPKNQATYAQLNDRNTTASCSYKIQYYH